MSLYGETSYKQSEDRLRLYQSVAPASMPITKAQCKLHLNLASDDTDHDDELDIQISAAVSKYEQDTSSAIITQTWVQYFPVLQDGLRLTRGPNTAVGSIAYYDSGNDSQTLSGSVYSFDQTTREIRLASQQTWPPTYSRWDAVTVTYTAGYADADAVPNQIKLALLLLVGAWFDGDRGDNPNPPQLRTYYNLIANLQRSSYP